MGQKEKTNSISVEDFSHYILNTSSKDWFIFYFLFNHTIICLFFPFVYIFVGNDHSKLWKEGLGSWLEEAGEETFLFILYLFSCFALLPKLWCNRCGEISSPSRDVFETPMCAPTKQSLLFIFLFFFLCVRLPYMPTFSLFRVSLEAVPLFEEPKFLELFQFTDEPVSLEMGKCFVLVHNLQKKTNNNNNTNTMWFSSLGFYWMWNDRNNQYLTNQKLLTMEKKDFLERDVRL